MNKVHECEIMVNIASIDTGIELRHYRTISLDGTDAATIVDSLIEQMDDDQVPWRKKLIAPMTDGCNTMAGTKKSKIIKVDEEGNSAKLSGKDLLDVDVYDIDNLL